MIGVPPFPLVERQTPRKRGAVCGGCAAGHVGKADPGCAGVSPAGQSHGPSIRVDVGSRVAETKGKRSV